MRPMHIAHRRSRPTRRLGHRVGAVVLTAGLALSAAGCGREDDKASDGAEVRSGPSATGTTSTAPANEYPDFAPQDYTYELEVLCYCPQVGVIGVTVAAGKVTEAKSITGETKGQDVPEFGRLTINDIIARANDPKVDEAEVTWPAGQDYPSTVALDHLKMATDDEVTYTIKDVQVQ